MKFNISGSDVAAPHNMSVHGQKWFNIFMQSLYNTFMPSMSPDFDICTFTSLYIILLLCCNDSTLSTHFHFTSEACAPEDDGNKQCVARQQFSVIGTLFQIVNKHC